MLKPTKSMQAAVLCGALLLSLPGYALAAGRQAQTAGTAQDNSAKNKHQQTTADQQKENTSDREITRKIRRAVVTDKTLSTYGHNVKIVTQGGAVTLKGPVHTDQEKQTIAAKAAEVVGQEKVTNQLTVKQ